MDDFDDHRSPRPLAAATCQFDQGAAESAGAHAEIIDQGGLVSPNDLDRLRSWLEAAMSALQAAGEVRVRLVADAEMAAAHARFSGIEGTTDVLTFDMRDDREDGIEPAAGLLDVDVWVCVDEARRQAAARGIEPVRELLLYCLHGVLHCLGHDDHTPDGFASMHAEEDRVLDLIGVGRTFALEPARTGGETP